MTKRIDMTGETYGWLKVLELSDIKTPSGELKWKCECRCGNITFVTRKNLKNGSTVSCGCFHKQQLAEKQRMGHQNSYDLAGEFGKGYTSKGEEFWFDLEDYDKIKNRTWCFNSQGYLISNPLRSENTTKPYLFHRVVMEPLKDDDYVDHKDCVGPNKLKYDNRKSNLRVCTNSQNAMNVGVKSNNKSGITGVWQEKKTGLWCAQIQKDGATHWLGRYSNIEEAIEARKKGEEKYFGEYAYQKET